MPSRTSAAASIRVSLLDAEAVTQAAAHVQADIMPLSPHSDSTIVPRPYYPSLTMGIGGGFLGAGLM